MEPKRLPRGELLGSEFPTLGPPVGAPAGIHKTLGFFFEMQSLKFRVLGLGFRATKHRFEANPPKQKLSKKGAHTFSFERLASFTMAVACGQFRVLELRRLHNWIRCWGIS